MPTQTSNAAEEASIRELIDRRIEAIREKDVDAVASAYLPDVVMFNLAPPLRTRGVDQVGVEKWFSSYRGAIGCEMRDLSVCAGDSVAFCHYLYRITGTLNEGKEVDMWVRATLCLRKTGGKWLIAHEHDSEPFDMQTFQALLDLKP